jgi:hypothetical protein
LRLAGLSIEAATVRASVINRMPGRTVLVRTAAFELREGSEDEKAEDLLSIITHLRDEDGVRGIVAGVGMTAFTHHFISLPLVKRPDIMHALGFELEKHLPLPPEEYFYDFATVSRSEENSNLMVLASLRSRLAWISEACQAAGVVLIGIRCTALEAMNEFAAEKEADGVLFLYRGHDSTSLFGMKDTSPVELKVLRKGSPAESDLKAFSGRYNRGTFSAADAQGPSIDALETTELDYDVPGILARSAFRKRRFDMQFAHGSGGSTAPLWHEQAPAVLGALCMIVFLLTSIVGYYKDISALNRMSNELKMEEEQSASLLNVRDELDSINSRKQQLNEFLSKRGLLIHALSELSARLPASAWLTNLSIDEQGRVQIQGYAARASEIIRPLDGSKLFRNVEFSSPVTIAGGRERFSIRMEIEK